MAKFLNTSAINYFLEDLIKSSKERLILISPYLKLSDRIRELLQDKNNLKVDIRIVYGKSELQGSEASWLASQQYIRTSFCKNLHAKCYMSESSCIISSLNLYEFSQINNNEMGLLIERGGDPETYQEAYDEALRLIRISQDAADTVPAPQIPSAVPQKKAPPVKEKEYAKLTTGKLAETLGVSTEELFKKLITAGYLSDKDGKRMLTETGKKAGGEFRKNFKTTFFIWPKNLTIEQLTPKTKTLMDMARERLTGK